MENINENINNDKNENISEEIPTKNVPFVKKKKFLIILVN